MAKRGLDSLEDTFIAYLKDVAEDAASADDTPQTPGTVSAGAGADLKARFSLRRLFSYARRESMELRRDPIRATLALLGTVMLMFIMGYGISMDVEDLSYAVLDRDQTTTSQAYALNIAGSRYFVEKPPLRSYEELDLRMRTGDCLLYTSRCV